MFLLVGWADGVSLPWSVLSRLTANEEIPGENLERWSLLVLDDCCSLKFRQFAKHTALETCEWGDKSTTASTNVKLACSMIHEIYYARLFSFFFSGLNARAC